MNEIHIEQVVGPGEFGSYVDLLKHEEFHFKLAQLALDMEMNSPSVQKSNKVGSCAAVHHVIPGMDSTNKLTHRHFYVYTR